MMNGVNFSGRTVVSTGNILSISDITKKPTQNSTQELADAIKYTIKQYLQTPSTDHSDSVTLISRTDDVRSKIDENGIEHLKIGLKLFLTSDNETYLHEALETTFAKQLNVRNVADVIVAFKKEPESRIDNMDEIKRVWKLLEKYVEDGKVGELGIADVEETTFRELYNWASVKPSIIQINLATCCVVPPGLQTFCKDNDIKLFTHSDSSDILPDQSVGEIFGESLLLLWAVRFTVHIKCRGVLITKGYCLSLSRK